MKHICRDCGRPIAVKFDRAWRCQRHGRFARIIKQAGNDGKTIPPLTELNRLADSLVRKECPVCKRKMNWLRRNGASTVITLQHDRDGGFRLICASCNARHARCEGDSFYEEIRPDQKRCHLCKKVKPLTEFPRAKRYWKGRDSRCKACSTIRHAKWVSKNREYYNRKHREYVAKRKAEGNPIPSYYRK